MQYGTTLKGRIPLYLKRDTKSLIILILEFRNVVQDFNLFVILNGAKCSEESISFFAFADPSRSLS